MNLYTGIFYVMVGIFCGLITLGIQEWLVRRRARKLFGRIPTQLKVDEQLRLYAGRLSYYQRLARNSGKGRRFLRLHRQARRDFRRVQRLAQHLGFAVRKNYRDYTLL